MMNYYRVKRLEYFLAAGIILWFFIFKSGVHSTIAGVILAFFIPLDKKSEQHSMLHKLENKLHVPVSRFIMPLFALANTAIVVNADMFDQIPEQDSSLGIIAGLVIGKPVGIMLFTILAVKLKLGKLPIHTTWKGLSGVAILGGIGFTMSIFIATLAFNDPSLIEFSKLSIFVGSGIATIVGLIVLYISTMKKFKTQR
jgi:NhaA family Na+:H+ antiporter